MWTEPHSMWNPCGMNPIPCGIHMESMEWIHSILGPNIFHVESIPCGFHMECGGAVRGGSKVLHLCLLFRVSTCSPNLHPFSICKPGATWHLHPSKPVPQHAGMGK